VRIERFPGRVALAQAAATRAVAALRDTLARTGRGRIVAATGTSQFEFLHLLSAAPGIDWTQVEMFHLDEYVGLPATHPASFRRYLRERLVDKTGITRAHFINADTAPDQECARLAAELATASIDLVFLGIGENGHIAFNDPPADFTTEAPYIVVELDRACRMQQVGEGWFPSLDDVPRHAITMSVQQILKGRELLCLAPDARKAAAVHAAVEGPITPMVPASILRKHPNCTLYLDEASAARL
jgi:glucosamine-6-phosphate deaminase